jgi:hypothetical protein
MKASCREAPAQISHLPKTGPPKSYLLDCSYLRCSSAETRTWTVPPFRKHRGRREAASQRAAARSACMKRPIPTCRTSWVPCAGRFSRWLAAHPANELGQKLGLRLVRVGVPQAVLDRYRSRGGAQSRRLTHPGRAAARKLHDAIDRLRLAHPLPKGPVGLSAPAAVVHSDRALTLRVVRWRPRRLSCDHPARLIIDEPVPGSCNA